MFYVYILKCKDSSYYTGHTDNLENCLYQHKNRIFSNCYTSTRLPIKLMYSEAFHTREEAIRAEKQIQGWSRRKKEALIQHNWKSFCHSILQNGAKAPPQHERYLSISTVISKEHFYSFEAHITNKPVASIYCHL